jgi:tetrahydromethanopterin S-methyltransferase subunit C
MSGPATQTTVSRKAVYSLVCGVLAFAAIYLAPFAGVLLALPSIVSGVHARREIAASKGHLSGDTVAVIGLMVGGGAIVTVVLSWALDVFG